MQNLLGYIVIFQKRQVLSLMLLSGGKGRPTLGMNPNRGTKRFFPWIFLLSLFTEEVSALHFPCGHFSQTHCQPWPVATETLYYAIVCPQNFLIDLCISLDLETTYEIYFFLNGISDFVCCYHSVDMK